MIVIDNSFLERHSAVFGDENGSNANRTNHSNNELTSLFNIDEIMHFSEDFSNYGKLQFSK
jgi:hypothetical protein